MRDLLALLAANVCFLASGSGLARLFGFWRTWWELLGVLGIAYVAGVAAVGIVATLMLIAGLSLVLWQVLVVCVLLALTGFFPRARPALPPALRTGAAGRRLVLAIAALLAVYLAALLARSYFEPLRHWDAWAMWTMKARAIVLLGGLDTRVFAGQAYAALHLDYPLFVPALEAIDFRFMGRITTRVVDVQFWFLFVGFLVGTVQLLRDRVNPVLLWPTLFLVAVSPSLATQLRWSIADFPLAIFIALAALCGWRYLETGERAFLALLALFAGAAWATKREGVAFVVGLYLVLFVFSRVRGRALGPLLLAALASLVALVPWSVWVAAHGLEPKELPLGKGVNPAYLLDRTGRLGPALRGLAEQAVKPSWWLVLLPLVLLTGLVAVRENRDRTLPLFLFSLLALMFASLVWAYWADVPEIHQHVQHTARRVVTGALAVAGVFLPLLVSQLTTKEPRGPDPVREAEPEARPRAPTLTPSA